MRDGPAAIARSVVAAGGLLWVIRDGTDLRAYVRRERASDLLTEVLAVLSQSTSTD